MYTNDPMTVNLSDLNPAQRDAVEAVDGPLLVLAGAGSGKTRVLTYRVAHLVDDLRVSPGEILAITFTNKAAGEMKERLGEIVGTGVRAMWVMTFHAMCVRMLRADAERVAGSVEQGGYDRNFTIYDTDDTKRMLTAVMAEFELDPKRYPVNGILGRISSAKSELIGPSEFEKSAVSPLDKATAKVYKRYRARMRDANAMDFDDLLVNAHTLLADNPDVLEAYQDRFRYISVDEYQDTNHAQYRIVNLLAAKHRNLMVVGDDDQSIYSWRGADIRNILEFERDYPTATVIRLEQNYRSTATILAAANAVVANNRGRKPKTLWTANAGGEAISSYHASDERDEAHFIATEIERHVRQGRSYAEFAIFYRTNAQSRVLEDQFLRAGVPYQIIGGTRFFERMEIRDVMAYVRAVANPCDEIGIKRIINTPKRKIGKATVDRIDYEALAAGITFDEALHRAARGEWLGTGPQAAVAKFCKLIDGLRVAVADGGSLRDLVEGIVEASGLLDALQAERTTEADGRVENIREFFGVVDEFSVQHEGAGIPEFMEWVALRADIDSMADAERSVTMMTVHTAKGLEFPIVFVAGMEDTIFPHANSMFEESGVEEERRLAYVAITRARERLYLTHAYQRALYGLTQYNPASRFLGEIPEEHVKTSGVGSQGMTGTGFARRGEGSRGSGYGIGRSAFGSSAPSEGRVYGAGAPKDSKQPKEPTDTFAVGDIVEHKVFGVGTVGLVSGDRIEVSFKTAGTKKLLAGYAPLRKVQD